MKFKKTTLPNGLRVITVPMKGNPMATTMVVTQVGSDYESKAENGLSHFLEHMCLKGTSRRPNNIDVSVELDSVGAMHNAFTSNEHTAYYAKAHKKHFKKMFDVISDIYTDPLLKPEEIEKERGVILQEISMYEDEPMSMASFVLTNLLYGDTPAGRDILGTPDNIKSFSRADFLNYHRKHYIPANTIVLVAGDITTADVMKEVRRVFSKLPTGKKLNKKPVTERQSSPQLLIRNKKTDQAHMNLAFRTWPAGDKRDSALQMLSYVLGRGSSSRVYRVVREEMSACYYIYSSAEQLSDRGFLAVSVGTDPKRVAEVTSAILKECKLLTTDLVGEEELSKAKEYFLGRVYFNVETSDNVSNFYLKQEVSTSKLKTPQEIEKEIRAITPKDIQKVAREIFKDQNLNLAIVGNISDEKGLKQALTLK